MVQSYIAKSPMDGGKKCLCVVFWLIRRSRVRRRRKKKKKKKKSLLGHPIARATSYCLLPDTLWLRGPKNAFKVGSVKFTVTAFHCEEGTHQNAGQKSKELTTPPESPNTWHLALFASTGTRRKQKRVRGVGGGLCMFVNKKWATNFTVRECISIRS